MTERTAGEKAAVQMVRRAMRDARINNAKLAGLIGMTVDTVGDFLNGKTWPHPITQGHIEDALGLPPGVIQARANGEADEDTLRLVRPPEDEARHGPISVDDATELQLAIALLERIRKRVEGA